ncbi:MAG: GDP-mannose 4,6-dehydratase, partial [Sphaerochaetaceae bacterium]
MGETYLVTGGAGFIGSNFVRHLLAEYGSDVRVVNVDKLTYAGNLGNLEGVLEDPRHEFVKADICDREAMGKVFQEHDVDYVVNFAAESHVDRSITDPGVIVRTNVEGTLVMLGCARDAWALPEGSFRKGKRYLQVSTDEVYGALGPTGFFTETTPLDPHSPYSASKA